LPVRGGGGKVTTPPLRSSASQRRPLRVVVVGAGFGGLAAAAGLARHQAQVTVVDRLPFTTFQPLLYQVATGGLNQEDVAYPVRSLLRRVRRANFIRGALAEVDWVEHLVRLADHTELSFDILVLATGATTSFFGVEGADAHALPLYTLADASHLKDSLILQLERAARSTGPPPRLRVVVIGGGATGVETAGALAELRDLLVGQDYPELGRSDISLELLERGPRLLSAFHPRLAGYARHQLERRGVVVRTGSRVARVDQNGVLLEGTERVACDLLVWAAGVAIPAEPAYRGLARTGSGRLTVNGSLQLTDHPEAFVVGDLAGARDRTGVELPQLAQPAIQEGRHVVRQLLRLHGGLPLQDFHYHDRGTMATIGRRAAVAELRGGVRLTGTLAWGAWLTLHLVELVGLRNRLSVLLNWTWRYFSWHRAVGLIPSPIEPASRPHPAGARTPGAKAVPSQTSGAAQDRGKSGMGA
jgi:NADH dehydrogenase